MENIDDLMRQKFDSDDPGERFEFQEEYWEQAQALLENNEQKRRRRFWLLIGLLLLAGLVLSLLCLRGNGGLFSDRAANKAEQEMSMQTPVAPENQQVGQLTENDKLQNKTDNANHPSNTAIDANPSSQQKTAQQAAGQANAGAGSGAQALGSGQTNKNLDAKKGKWRLNQYGAANERISQNTAVSEPSSPTNAKDLGGAVANNPNPANATTAGNLTNQTDQAVNSQSGESQTDRVPEAIDPAIRQVEINTLPVFLYPFPIPERTIVPQSKLAPTKLPIAENIQPKQDKRFSLGLSLAASANSTDSIGKWAGWAFGVYGDYKLNKTWSVTLGAQWRFVPGKGAFTTPSDSSNPDYSEQLRYSFGYARETWKAETRGLHFLELPLTARWQKGRLGVEAGGAIGQLLAVHNRTEYTKETSFEPAQTTIKKYVQGSKDGYNSTYFTAHAGGVYRLNNRFSLFVKGQYRFTPVFKSVNEGLSNLDLGLRVRLY